MATFASIIALLTGLAKAFPVFADLFNHCITLIKEYDNKRNQAEALKRLESKDAAVDAALAQYRVRPSEARQHNETDSSPRLP